MLRILLCLLFLLLLVVSPVSAIDLTPSPQPAAPQGEVLGIFDEIFNFLNNLLGEKKVPEEITAVSQRTLPKMPASDSTGSTDSNVEISAIGYGQTYSSVSPNNMPIDKQTFFDKIMSFFGLGLTDSLVVKGNEDAEGYLSAGLPQNVGRQAIAGNKTDSPLAQGETNILGNETSNEDMAYALCLKKCGVLPLALCSCGEYGGTNPDEPPDTPPNGPELPPTGGDLPAVCYERPTCNNGVGDCYKDTSSGQCWIYTKGFCSVDCLKPFFGDETTAKIASQICNRESGGDPTVINRGCLKPVPSDRTQEYSVGLFQLNLWPDEYRHWRCPGALQNKIGPPPPYSCQEGPNFDTCRVDFQNAKKNIQAAYELYRNRGNKWGDWAAAGACGIQ